jgi:hypothetical protein
MKTILWFSSEYHRIAGARSSLRFADEYPEWYTNRPEYYERIKRELRDMTRNARIIDRPTTNRGLWLALDSWLGNRARRKIGSNCTARRGWRAPGDTRPAHITVTLYSTDIIQVESNGCMTLDWGIWCTVTTNKWFNALLPAGLSVSGLRSTVISRRGSLRVWEYVPQWRDGSSVFVGPRGKITGAGGGGFLLLYCPRDRQPALRDALKEYRELPFHLERDGTKVIFNYRRSA